MPTEKQQQNAYQQNRAKPRVPWEILAVRKMHADKDRFPMQ